MLTFLAVVVYTRHGQILMLCCYATHGVFGGFVVGDVCVHTWSMKKDEIALSQL